MRDEAAPASNLLERAKAMATERPRLASSAVADVDEFVAANRAYYFLFERVCLSRRVALDMLLDSKGLHSKQSRPYKRPHTDTDDDDDDDEIATSQTTLMPSPPPPPPPHSMLNKCLHLLRSSNLL